MTYQNIGTSTATISFIFTIGGSSDAVTINRTLEPGASDSAFLGNLSGAEALPISSLQIASNQPLAMIQVQIPQSTTVKNRPLSNIPFFGSSQLYAATALNNRFGATTVMSVQNQHSSAADIGGQLYNADDLTATPVPLPTRAAVAPGNIVAYDLGHLSAVPAGFNGSAVFTAVQSGTSTAAAISGTILELETADVGARAIEMISTSATKLYAATALCNAFGGYTTAYAVQNASLTTATLITINYSNDTFETKRAEPGGKVSFNTCGAADMPSGFSGAAIVTSSATPILGIGKATGNSLFTGFVLEQEGYQKLALPYVRYTSDDNFERGSRQRTNIAIQNIGDTTVTNVQVRYLDKLGNLVGTHTISTIAAGQKANSKPVDAGSGIALLEFGTPDSNPGGGFGGGAIIEAPAGSQLIAIARVNSKVGTNQVAEDYNAIGIE
ncbi:MAG: hypothetical protein R2932_44565 [Caldilineaceae bacterium]